MIYLKERLPKVNFLDPQNLLETWFSSLGKMFTIVARLIAFKKYTSFDYRWLNLKILVFKQAFKISRKLT